MKKLFHPISRKIHGASIFFRGRTWCGIYISYSPGVAADIPVTCQNCKRIQAASTEAVAGGAR